MPSPVRYREGLREEVLAANLALVRHNLVTLTWGNASGIDREAGLIAIKASGVAYDTMGIDDIVVLTLNGEIVEGDRRPSTDTPTHLELYRSFSEIGGVIHTPLHVGDLLGSGRTGDPHPRNYARGLLPRSGATGAPPHCRRGGERL